MMRTAQLHSLAAAVLLLGGALMAGQLDIFKLPGGGDF